MGNKKMDELMARLERTERLEQQHREQLRAGEVSEIMSRRWEHSSDPAERAAYEVRRHRKNYEWKNFYAPAVAFIILLLLVKIVFR
ncbi:hypothetical protein LRP30_02945 [Bradyrhizobium sp. C-145]|uniref:hypothetical protein n=1 Tax=Bradyrhizobium sp. C-145 TaxID=574727 RepID=UPI00201B8C16|nr:hypothetical protein [Bradyrhizobium sp. C-145]UQR64293.1 hypothetical protein LRP30_02945 [Bradyrhizobium sp. C-145]